jgi:putative flippase GtrA
VRKISSELLRFCIVGSIGFAIDAGLTLLLTQPAQWKPENARLVGFLCAATVTWNLNRRFTFRSNSSVRSLLPYIALTTVGALVNFAIFVAWLRLAGTSPAQILVGVALGAVVALGLNFAVSRRFVYRIR